MTRVSGLKKKEEEEKSISKAFRWHRQIALQVLPSYTQREGHESTQVSTVSCKISFYLFILVGSEGSPKQCSGGLGPPPGDFQPTDWRSIWEPEEAVYLDFGVWTILTMFWGLHSCRWWCSGHKMVLGLNLGSVTGKVCAWAPVRSLIPVAVVFMTRC